MRTNIGLNDELILETIDLSELDTKKEVVEIATIAFINQKKRKSMVDLHDKISF